MMTLLALELQQEIESSLGAVRPAVDIGVSKLPYYHDKAVAIDESGIYEGHPQQVHLTGFDSLIRIFNTKYYPPAYTLAPLEPFLSKHRLRVTYRTDGPWGGREEQEKYVQDIADGLRENEGAKREWAAHIELVQGKADGEEVVSSTQARKAANEDASSLGKYVTQSVLEWILSERLYLEGDLNK
jgi:nicotinamide-nucleotide adenylyltransferase